MTDHSAWAYDERRLAQQLEGMGADQRRLFTIACSQVLRSAYCTIAEETGDERPAVFEDALAEVWAVAAGRRGAEGIAELDPLVADATPHDDSEDWVDSSGFLQSAGIALLHAVAVVATGALGHPVFAARQVSEVAEHVVYLADDDADEGGSDVDRDAVLGLAKDVVHRQLDVVGRWDPAEPLDLDVVREGCRRDGAELGTVALREVRFHS